MKVTRLLRSRSLKLFSFKLHQFSTNLRCQLGWNPFLIIWTSNIFGPQKSGALCGRTGRTPMDPGVEAPPPPTAAQPAAPLPFLGTQLLLPAATTAVSRGHCCCYKVTTAGASIGVAQGASPMTAAAVSITDHRRKHWVPPLESGTPISSSTAELSRRWS
jgi:hypothetical protein